MRSLKTIHANMGKHSGWVLFLILLCVGAACWLLFRRFFPGSVSGIHSDQRDAWVIEWINHPEAHPDWSLHTGERCPDAPFQFPTDGMVGYLWDDSFRPGHRHQGIDIFGGTLPGKTPVYTASDGFLTRLKDWKSSVILRLPQDPLQPTRQIWTYYTHMADENGNSFISADFPPGSQEVFVQAGTLLGYQGNFSGTPGAPVGVHLHFSVVLDDGQGNFLNELEIQNTLDPSPYFGLPLNAHQNDSAIPLCPDTPTASGDAS